MKLRGIITACLLFVPAASFAANKEMEVLQRDVALMQEDIRQLQRSFDQQIAILKTLEQQAVDNTSRISTSVGVVQQTLPDQIKREVNAGLAPLAGLNTRLDQVSSQVQTLSDAVQALNSSMQQLHTQLTDLKNVVAAIQVPAAPPPQPSADPNAPSAIGPNSSLPPVPLEVLYANARRDMDGGKPDLALSEFSQCIKYYPGDPAAAKCQFYIGMIHASRSEFDDAVKEFDSVLEQYPKGEKTADAYYYKGLALVKMGHSREARKEFLAVIQQYPKTPAAELARAEMKVIGFNVPPKGKK